MAQRRGWGGAATLWGLLFGAFAVVLVLGDHVVFAAGRAARPLVAGGLWARLALAVLGLAFFFLAGVIAARSTRRIEAGIVAGLLAGAVVGVAGIIATLLAVGTVERHLTFHPAGRVARALVAGALGRSVAILLLATLVGAGLGALGGLAGRGRPPISQAYPYRPPTPPPGNDARPAFRYTPAPGHAPDAAQAPSTGHPVPPSVGGDLSHPEAPTITPPAV